MPKLTFDKSKTPKKKKDVLRICPICESKFKPKRKKHIICSGKCGLKAFTTKTGKKKFKLAKDRKRKEALKTKSDLLRDAQWDFNAFIRQRDKGLPCISCGTLESPVWDAGHYQNVGGHPALRFNELNVHKQCRCCNSFKHGNLINYRIGLIRRIGESEVEKLEGITTPLLLSRFDIIRLKKAYKEKLKSLKNIS